MVTRALTLEGAGLVLPMESDEFAVLNGASGFAFPPRTVRWFSGAGDGDVYRGTRINRRPFKLPTLLRGRDADQLQERMDVLASIYDPDNEPAILRLNQGEQSWWTRVVLTDGGDVVYGTDTNGSSYVVLNLVVEAGDPMWTRTAPVEPKVVRPAPGRGLLKRPVPGAPGGPLGGFGAGTFGVGPFGSGAGSGGGTALPASLTYLRVMSGQGLGAVSMVNPGGAKAWPTTTITGPATSLDLVSPSGEVLQWAGSLQAGEHRFLDHTTKTITDDQGVNRYRELGAAPVFWAVPPGNSQATVLLNGADAVTSSVAVNWYPRRWVLI